MSWIIDATRAAVLDSTEELPDLPANALASRADTLHASAELDALLCDCICTLARCGNLQDDVLESVLRAFTRARGLIASAHVEQQSESLKRAIAARDRQLQIATHELRTPISTILLNLQMLERACRDKDALDCGIIERLLAVPKRQLTRLVRMVDLLLDSAQVESERLVLSPEELDLSAIVHDVVGRHTEMARGHACSLMVRFCEPIIGEWDRLRIEQVVSNLVTNAIKYGGLRVEVHAEHVADGAQIVVADSGRGIAREDQARIFEPYERLATGSNGDGAGLGLYIVREIVRAHGGRIEVDSSPGGGATFTVLLPITSKERKDGRERQAP